MKLAKENILSIAIAIMAMAIAAIVIVSLRQSQQVRKASAWVSHTNEVLYRTEQVLNATLELEASSKAATGSHSKTAEDHKRSARAMYYQIAVLRNLVSDNPIQQKRCDSLLNYAGLEMRAGWQTGPVYTGQVRDIIDDIQADETTLLQSRKIETAHAIQLLRSIFYGLIGLALILVVFIVQKLLLDMKNRRKALTGLQYSATVMANISDAVITIDNSGFIRSWNHGAEKLYGYSAREVMGKLLADIARVDLSEQQRDEIGRILRGQNQWSGALTHKTKSGEDIYLQSAVSTIKSDHDTITGYVVVIHDLTDRFRAEEHLKSFNKELEFQVREKTAELKDIFERVTDAMVALDRNWHYTFVNKKAGDIIGRDPETLIGKHIWSEFPEVIDPPFYHALRKAMEQQQYVFFEEFHPFLERWLENHIYPSPLGISIFFRDVTEQRQASMKLQEQQADVRALVENIPDPVFSMNMEFELLTFNSAFAKMMFGFTGAEVNRGMNIFQRYPEVRKQRFFAMANRAMKAERFSFEDELAVNNDIVYYEILVNPILNESRQQIGISFLYQDITARKKAEEAIRQSEEKYRTIYYKNPLPKWIYDYETLRFLDVNDAAVEHYGYSREEFLNMTIMDIRPSEDAPVVREDLIRSMSTTDPSHGYWRHVTKNGEVIRVEVTGHYISYDNRRARMVVVNDITKRLEAEEKLAAERNLLRVLINNLPDYIYVKDAESRYILINRAIIELLGVKWEHEVVGKKVGELFGEAVAKVNNEEDGRILATGETVIGRDEQVTTHSGEHRWLLTTKVPLRDQQGSVIGIVGISHDITERKQTEVMLEELNEDLRKRANQLAATNAELEQFAYIASHDLQEPLRTTTGFIELLRRQYYGKMDETADKYLNFIADASDRMKVLIKDLLDYSRIGRKKELHMVDCNAVLKDVLKDLGGIVKETNASVSSDELPVIKGYRTELKLLFQNLISNAIKFRRGNASPVIHISVKKTGAFREFSFQDNGIGIDPQHRERIFVIFQRLHTRMEYEGSGIGLAHCKKIVELHGGKIWVNSTPGEGSSFHFTIYDHL